ncbi:ABC transporter ATP-binding protein [Dongia deserti]|uniref:ABC transporter ATP-binding protein n=1 Tax=Dongia deserti TaxID=2268030 RepID=UPI000E64CFB1|nr:ABC transporter ATP-binding protein [Dongia deserti]
MTARLSISNLSKRFGPVIANDGVSLEIRPGELHCLLGENGAGKSTLSSCLYGLYQPDQGRIVIDGEERRFRSPADAIRASIGMVHQHFVLVPTFTVLENIVVGTGAGWRLDTRAARRRVSELCQRNGLQLNLDALVGDLSVGEQQWVEIVKALYLGARVLILDEPTAVLTPQESERLFTLLQQMTADGLSIILITHKMNEVMRSDRVTVLRRGRVVGTVETGSITREELTQMMIGRQLKQIEAEDRAGSGAPAVVTISAVSLRDARRVAVLDNLSLELRAGEVLGLAGVAGNGQRELFEAIAGVRRTERGEIRLDGKSVANLSAADIARRGVGYVPEDRFRDGLVPDLTIAENIVLGQQWQAPWRRGVLLDAARMREHAARSIADFSIATTGPGERIRRLSGGNAQKVILARELAKATRCLLCNQPTRGLDVGVIEYVHGQILRKRQDGVAILLASEELEDLMRLSDRIAVIFRGRIMGILPRHSASIALLGQMMAGTPLEQAA